MSLSTPFIERPVATTLLTIGVALAGLFAFNKLPVSPLPQVDFPTISVTATMPGASADTMAETVATPLERHLGVIADASINAGPEPFLDPLDLAHIRRRRVTLSLTSHDTKLVKRCPPFVHETVRLANIPLHHLSAAEISHISDVGVG